MSGAQPPPLPTLTAWRVVREVHLPLDTPLQLFGVRQGAVWRTHNHLLQQLPARAPPPQPVAPPPEALLTPLSARPIRTHSIGTPAERERSPYRPRDLDATGTVLTLAVPRTHSPAGRGRFLLEVLVVAVLEEFPSTMATEHEGEPSTLATEHQGQHSPRTPPMASGSSSSTPA